MEICIESDVEKFIMALQKSTIAKVLRNIDLLERFGYQLGSPHTKKIRDDLFEIHIRGRQEVRIFYIFSKRKIILLHGFVKKTQKIPQRELKAALRKFKDLT